MAGGATDAAAGSGGAEDDDDSAGMDGAESDVVPGAVNQSEFVAPRGIGTGDPGILVVRGDVHDGELSDGDDVVLIEDELDRFVRAAGGACEQACGEKREDGNNALHGRGERQGDRNIFQGQAQFVFPTKLGSLEACLSSELDVYIMRT